MRRSPATWRIIPTSIATWPRGTRRHKPSKGRRTRGDSMMRNSSRRTFLKTAGALGAAACMAGRFSPADVRHVPVGLQLYSLREQLPRDFDGTLHQLGAIGIKEVEAAGYFHKTAAEFRHS